jgi:hypothetical protein
MKETSQQVPLRYGINSYVHIKVKNIMPDYFERFLLVINIHWQPNSSTLPERIRVPLSIPRHQYKEKLRSSNKRTYLVT